MKKLIGIIGAMATISAETTFCDNPMQCPIIQSVPITTVISNAAVGVYRFVWVENFPVIFMLIVLALISGAYIKTKQDPEKIKQWLIKLTR